jgi:hypothetical protein
MIPKQLAAVRIELIGKFRSKTCDNENSFAVTPQNPLTMRVDLAVKDRLHAGTLESEIKTAYSCEEGSETHVTHPALDGPGTREQGASSGPKGYA